MQIKITRLAARDLEETRRYLKPRTNVGLRNVTSSIKKAINEIPNSLSRGRKTPHDEVWEKLVPKYGYIIPYYVEGDTVYILRIYDTRREPLDYSKIKKLD